MSNTPKKPFFQRTWVMVLFLLLLAPVGIFLIWKNCPRWHPAVKAGLSIMCGLIWIGAVISGGGSSEPSKNVPQSVVETDRSTPAPEADAQPEPDATEVQTDTPDDPIEADPIDSPQDFTITEPEPEPEPTPDRSTPTPDPDPVSYNYVGSIESNKYHYPSCQHAKKILQENLIGWDTVEEAQAAGYEPCGVCHPH